MQFDSLADLPASVRDNLPQHAQEIFRAAFNNAWNEYADPADRRDHDSREETAFRVAWGAVEQSYHKNDAGDWVRNDG